MKIDYIKMFVALLFILLVIGILILLSAKQNQENFVVPIDPLKINNRYITNNLPPSWNRLPEYLNLKPLPEDIRESLDFKRLILLLNKIPCGYLEKGDWKELPSPEGYPTNNYCSDEEGVINQWNIDTKNWKDLVYMINTPIEKILKQLGRTEILLSRSRLFSGWYEKQKNKIAWVGYSEYKTREDDYILGFRWLIVVDLKENAFKKGDGFKGNKTIIGIDLIGGTAKGEHIPTMANINPIDESKESGPAFIFRQPYGIQKSKISSYTYGDDIIAHQRNLPLKLLGNPPGSAGVITDDKELIKLANKKEGKLLYRYSVGTSYGRTS